MAIMSGKRPASERLRKTTKMPRKVISMDVKMKVIRKVEAGERQVDVGRSLGLASSTVKTILANSEKIKRTSQSTTSSVAMKVFRTRNKLLETMESRLSMWVEDQNQRHMPLSQLIIMEKARSLFTYLQEQEGEGSSMETFVASRGWFEKFKRRSNLSLQMKNEMMDISVKDEPLDFNGYEKEIGDYDTKNIRSSSVKQSLQMKNEMMDISVKDEPLDFNGYEKKISDYDTKNIRSSSVKQVLSQSDIACGIEDEEENEGTTTDTNQPQKHQLHKTYHTPRKWAKLNGNCNYINTAIEKLGEISRKMDVARKENTHDHFGRYISSILSELPSLQSLNLQNQIIEMVLKEKMASLEDSKQPLTTLPSSSCSASTGVSTVPVGLSDSDVSD